MAVTSLPGPTVFFDLETQRLAEDVGGWAHIERMGLACAVTYSTATGGFRRYLEADAQALVSELQSASLVVGFNLRRFDYAVLQPYTQVALRSLPTLDMLEHLYRRLGFRVSLDSLAAATLGRQKTADGVQAVEWYRRGMLERLLEYCEQDVQVTRDLYEYGRRHGQVKFRDKRWKIQSVPVAW